jgi:CheY-like chemotaxis protein
VNRELAKATANSLHRSGAAARFKKTSFPNFSGTEKKRELMESIGSDGTAIEVLLVEDKRNEVLLTREALKNARAHINLHVASDGVEARAFLGGEGEHAGVPRPDLILLDMNLPKKNGPKVLEEIKRSHAPKSIDRRTWLLYPIPVRRK